MVYKRTLILTVVFISILMVVKEFNLNPFNKKKLLGISNEVVSPRASHQVKFFDERTFYEGVDYAKNIEQVNYQIKGAITPHDYFEGFIIAQFFKRLSFQNPKTIILIGPNHFEKGEFKALTSFYNWDTPFGQVVPDDLSIKTLINQNLVKVDEETLANDHAVSGIMPFVKYYLPNTKVVPLLLSGSLSKNESQALANFLSSLITKDVIIVAAVDFSHYLTSKQSQEKDKVTLQVIGDFNYHELYLLNNDNLDSPPSIGVLLMAMQQIGTTKMDLLYHNDSANLQSKDIPTTSFFSLTYY